ncbi:excalibur calcium-binding domain-containing protein [Corynebacterium glucuronolyticum]|uniref:Excalibur calcium-binding domain-containing protein n=1 Tax=Corynebacterium glucuronolyticum TaxID=39791 RepID=A0A7T4EHX6_9CORY|nr:excalibur calcium-binding domain-containing protein [Corynebacterium glucuronolyticum]
MQPPRGCWQYGRWPDRQGEQSYSRSLDRDGDGVECESPPK